MVGMAENNITDKKTNRNKALKIAAVGDGMVGKTCMLITYTSNSFPQEYVPTVFDNFNDKIIVDGEEYSITLWDTAGQEDYEKLRPLTYPNTDCFLLCFSISNKTSYDNIISKWYPELKRFCPTVPIILVATKIDLREKQEGLIPASAGRKLRRKIGAAKYLECSALKSQGLESIFIEAVRATCKKRKHGHNFCSVM